MTPSSQNDAERFRKEAEECRELAEKAMSPLDKEAWMRLAEDWLKLAQEAERGTGLGGWDDPAYVAKIYKPAAP
jgi:hypothetical protein